MNSYLPGFYPSVTLHSCEFSLGPDQSFIAAIILIIVNCFAIAPLIPKVNERDICKNINDLKKRQWVKNILHNEECW